jgi:hypothetical protein
MLKHYLIYKNNETNLCTYIFCGAVAYLVVKMTFAAQVASGITCFTRITRRTILFTSEKNRILPKQWHQPQQPAALSCALNNHLIWASICFQFVFLSILFFLLKKIYIKAKEARAKLSGCTNLTNTYVFSNKLILKHAPVPTCMLKRYISSKFKVRSSLLKISVTKMQILNETNLTV